MEMIQFIWNRDIEDVDRSVTSLNSESGFNEETRWLILASNYSSIATHGIALEHDDSRDYFKLYCEAMLEVFKRRGTTKKIFRYQPTGDGMQDIPCDDPMDYSVTNSKSCLIATFTALSIGEIDMAKQIALLAWDPPKADYVSTRSIVCRPYD